MIALGEPRNGRLRKRPKSLTLLPDLDYASVGKCMHHKTYMRIPVTGSPFAVFLAPSVLSGI
jgi:hypothetical protein